jgi:hypothetical protein
MGDFFNLQFWQSLVTVTIGAGLGFYTALFVQSRVNKSSRAHEETQRLRREREGKRHLLEGLKEGIDAAIRDLGAIQQSLNPDAPQMGYLDNSYFDVSYFELRTLLQNPVLATDIRLIFVRLRAIQQGLEIMREHVVGPVTAFHFSTSIRQQVTDNIRLNITKALELLESIKGRVAAELVLVTS